MHQIKKKIPYSKQQEEEMQSTPARNLSALSGQCIAHRVLGPTASGCTITLMDERWSVGAEDASYTTHKEHSGTDG